MLAGNVCVCDTTTPIGTIVQSSTKEGFSSSMRHAVRAGSQTSI